MDDPLLVRVGQPLAQLDRHFELLRQRHADVVAALQQRLEVLAAQELHDDIGRAVDLAELVDGDDITMLQSRDGLRFALEPLAGGGVQREVDVHHFQRDIALELRIVRPVEHSHPAASDEFDNVIAADGLRDWRHIPLGASPRSRGR